MGWSFWRFRSKICMKYFSLTILVSACFGLFFPSLGTKLNFLVLPSLFILMFYTVLKINFYKLKHSIFVKYLIIGVLTSSIIIPLILYIIAQIFNFNEIEKMSVSSFPPSLWECIYFVVSLVIVKIPYHISVVGS